MNNQIFIVAVLATLVASCSSTPDNQGVAPGGNDDSSIVPVCRSEKHLKLTDYDLALQASMELGFKEINADVALEGKFGIRSLAIRSMRILYDDYHEYFDCNVSITKDDALALSNVRVALNDYISEVESILDTAAVNERELLIAARDRMRTKFLNFDFGGLDGSLQQLTPDQKTKIRENLYKVEIPLSVTTAELIGKLVVPEFLNAKACLSSNEKLVQPVSGAGLTALSELQSYYHRALRLPNEGRAESFSIITLNEVSNLHHVAQEIEEIEHTLDYFDCPQD